MTAHARHQHADTAADDLRDHIAELTRSRAHREQLSAKIGHTVVHHSHFAKVPPLLAQLRYADWTKGQERGGSGYESRPAASIEALVVLSTIDLEAARWIRNLGEDDPTSTIDCVRLLGGLLPSAHRCSLHRGHEHDGACHNHARGWCCTWHAVEHDVRRWWTQARIVTGWDAPAWRPDNTCPMCGVRRSLRIRLAERVGFCTECQETWPPDAYQVLANHIRSESDLRTTRVSLPLGPCLCRWPRPTFAAASKLCPRCGTSTCAYAPFCDVPACRERADAGSRWCRSHASMRRSA